MKISPISFRGSVNLDINATSHQIASIKDEKQRKQIVKGIWQLEKSLEDSTPDNYNFQIKILSGHYFPSMVSYEDRLLGNNKPTRKYIENCILHNEIGELEFRKSHNAATKNFQENSCGEYIDIKIEKASPQTQKAYRKTIILTNSKKTSLNPQIVSILSTMGKIIAQETRLESYKASIQGMDEGIYDSVDDDLNMSILQIQAKMNKNLIFEDNHIENDFTSITKDAFEEESKKINSHSLNSEEIKVIEYFNRPYKL